jgi:hypothetical protein
MSSSRLEAPLTAFARAVRVTDERLFVELTDGREISAPLTWYPRLRHARPQERANWELVGRGDGIHWPALDEDISVEGLLAGRKSGESKQSFETWLTTRAQRRG